MSKTFTVTIPEKITLEAGVKMVREGVEAEGGSYNFDTKTNRGSFSLRGILGEFLVAGREVLITIKKKPLLIPQSLIESTVRGYIASAA